jgi:hypothetical protein
MKLDNLIGFTLEILFSIILLDIYFAERNGEERE